MTESPVTATAAIIRIWGPVCLVAPALLFPLRWPTATVILLLLGVVALAAAARAGVGAVRARTPLDLPILVVLATFSLAALLSTYPELTLPKLTGVLFGALVFRATVLTATSRAKVRFLMAAYLAAGCAAVAGGVLAGPNWKGKMWPWWNLRDDVVPRLLTLPGAEHGINPNALAATTLFALIPLLWLGVVSRGAGGRTPAVAFERAACLVGATALLGVLLLCQSRSTWAGFAIAIVLMAGARSRLATAIAGSTLVAVVLAAVTVGVPTLLDAADHVIMPAARVVGGPETARKTSQVLRTLARFESDDRRQIWSAGLERVAAQPLLGLGPGAFRGDVAARGIPGLTPAQMSQVVHAHNIFLQVALDGGVLALTAYTILLILASRMVFAIRRSSPDRHLWHCALGLWGALVAIHVFGLTDAIAPGSKVGLFFWWNLGLIGAVHSLVTAPRVAEVVAVG